jgi:L,D-peptidoglycan transpeptidase YkuD (ErfK/YbiS/YcfS/YnhG family)
VLACERHGQGWSDLSGPIPAVVGRNGFATPGAKREGDGTTPSGTFCLEEAFGYAPRIETAMPYRQIREDDIWVDDPASPDYNQWKKKGAVMTRSYEEMRRADGLYEVGIVIGYNRSPALSGRGSAIFFHIWQGRGIPTSGCVAMAREDLLRILSWLDPLKAPAAILGMAG